MSRHYDYIVKGGNLVTPHEIFRSDVAVSGGRIVATGLLEGNPVVDASGLLIMPGMVDTHVHLMDPGPTEREDFPHGTAAAAVGGITTIIDHTHAHPLRRPGDVFEKVAYLRDRSNVDFGLAAHLWPEDVSHMEAMWNAGISFFKIFTCTTHGVPGLAADDLHAALTRLAGFGGIALLHCEDESLTRRAEQALKSQSRLDPALLTEWRSREAELVAVAGAAVLAGVTRATVNIAHVSNPVAADIATTARRGGVDVAAEACPQYFALAESEVVEHGPLHKFTPPARIRTEDDRDRMWSAVTDGAFSHFASDHAPSTLAQKTDGDFWSAPFGLPGLDTTLPFLLDAALSGRIKLVDVVRLFANAPAARYGLAPRKGILGVGSDADMVLVDPDGTWEIRNEDIVSKAGWSPYSGRTFRGSIVATYLRGEKVAEDRHPVDGRTGRFVPGPGADTG